jgi:hypothetical protein
LYPKGEIMQNKKKILQLTWLILGVVLLMGGFIPLNDLSLDVNQEEEISKNALIPQSSYPNMKNLKLAGNFTDESMSDIVIANDTIYGANRFDGLKIYDLSDPLRPTKIGEYLDDAYPNSVDLTIHENYCYLAEYYDGIQILDISDPTSIVEIGNYSERSDYVAYTDVCVVDDYLYAIFLEEGYMGLKIFNVSDPTNPTYLGGLNKGGYKDIQVIGEIAYMAGVNGFTTVNISDPTNPIILGSTTMYYISGYYISGSTISESFAIRGDFAFVATRVQGLFVFNISNVSNFSLVAHFEMPDQWLYDIWIEGSYAFVCSLDEEIWVFDITDPTNPVQKAYYLEEGAEGYTSCQVYGTYLYVVFEGHGLKIFNIGSYLGQSSSIPSYPLAITALIGVCSWTIVLFKKKEV